MESYEAKAQKEKTPPSKLDMSIVKYFWLAGPHLSRKEDNIPKFLRNADVFKNFSDNELRILSKYLHLRTFTEGEIIFNQGDIGIGFYLVFSGKVSVIIQESFGDEKEGEVRMTIEKGQCFGELALLQSNSVRSGSVLAAESSELLGIFKPDLDEMIQEYPVVASRFLQALGVIVTNRLFALNKELRSLRQRITSLEKGGV